MYSSSNDNSKSVMTNTDQFKSVQSLSATSYVAMTPPSSPLENDDLSKPLKSYTNSNSEFEPKLKSSFLKIPLKLRRLNLIRDNRLVAHMSRPEIDRKDKSNCDLVEYNEKIAQNWRKFKSPRARQMGLAIKSGCLIMPDTNFIDWQNSIGTIQREQHALQQFKVCFTNTIKRGNDIMVGDLETAIPNTPVNTPITTE